MPRWRAANAPPLRCGRPPSRRTAGPRDPGPGHWLPGVALGAAGARSYRLYRPPGLRPTSLERVPLVVMLHGCGQNGRGLAISSRMNRAAAHSAAMPGAAGSAGGALRAMRSQQLPAVLPAAVGKALGAAAQFTLLPPLLVLHGTADQVAVPSNARQLAEIRATATGSKPLAPRTLQRGRRLPAQITDFRRARRTMVRLAEIDSLGHAWSGGLGSQPFSDPRGPDATRMIWAFAQRAFRERPGS